MTDWLNGNYRILDCDSAVIHNMPEYKLRDGENLAPERRACSLEWMGPKLLEYLSADNFAVAKTYIPYPGISMIDMRYRLASPPASVPLLLEALQEACKSGPLKNLYGFEQPNQVPEAHLNSPYSAVLRRQGVRLVGDNLYLSCYFDNENSVNRYFDLVDFIAAKA